MIMYLKDDRNLEGFCVDFAGILGIFKKRKNYLLF